MTAAAATSRPTRTCARLCASVAVLVLAGCATLQPRPPLPVEQALPPGDTTPLDRTIGAAEQAHPGESAFRLLREGPEAFAVRARTAQLVERSLDLQTYIWNADGTGTMLASLILSAADRGAKVRLLVDDMDARDKNYGFAALDAHPNIEVRMFNPFSSRTGTLSYVFEAVGSFERINRRMHNKTWIADNRVAVVGGRNLGDEYFGASDEVNFTDLDFAMAGPVVRDASASFDKYWNSDSAYPMALLVPAGTISPEALDRLRSQLAKALEHADESRYAEELRRNDAVRRLVSGDWPMSWSPEYRFVSDDPAKVLGKQSGIGGSQVLEFLWPVLKDVRTSLSVTSPYFVPGEAGAEGFVAIHRAGVDVGILTNSLAANDVAMVYGAYSRSRKPLLEGGVKLWEMKPTPGTKVASSMFGSSGASLHTKALTADHRATFVGSYNLDPRSTSLNCEQGVYVVSPEIAATMERIFAVDTSPDHAWALSLEDGKLRWSDGSTTYGSSPDASAGRRFQAWLARVLGLDSQL
ncbi:MAG: phospholipase D family protein [Steroidobacteraceae bacterium]